MSLFVEKTKIKYNIAVTSNFKRTGSKIKDEANLLITKKFLDMFNDGFFMFHFSNLKVSGIEIYNPASPKISISFDAYGTRVSVGQILKNIKIEKIGKNMAMGTYNMRMSKSGRYISVIIIPDKMKPNWSKKTFQLGELIDIVILDIIPPFSGEYITITATEFNPEEYLKFNSILPCPKFACHFGQIGLTNNLKASVTSYFRGPELVKELQRAGATSKISGKGKKDEKTVLINKNKNSISINDVYTSKFNSDKYRYLELFKIYVMSRIIRKEHLNVIDNSPKKIVTKLFGKTLEIGKKGDDGRNQTIKFISDSSKIPIEYKLNQVNDFIVFDGSIEDIPRNIVFYDIFFPICSDRYFTILNSPNNFNSEETGEYSRLMLELRKDNIIKTSTMRKVSTKLANSLRTDYLNQI